MSGFECCLITNRLLCGTALPDRVDRVLAAGFRTVIMREKDLDDNAAARLAGDLAEVASRRDARLIVNSNLKAAEASGAWGVQLPFAMHAELAGDKRLRHFKVGVSIHTLEEGLRAEARGCDWVLAGHVFRTDCKQGMPGRGTEFIRTLAQRLRVPVWAVGGIVPENMPLLLQNGASVGCVMSSLMRSPAPASLAKEYIRSLAEPHPVKPPPHEPAGSDQ